MIFKRLTDPITPQVGDVITKLFGHFEVLLGHTEYNSLSEDQQTTLGHATWANFHHMRTMGDSTPNAQPYIRNVDKLLGESVFEGLDSNPDFVARRLGERDCSVLQMHFKPRSKEW